MEPKIRIDDYEDMVRQRDEALAALKEARETNQKLHRRVQQQESPIQSKFHKELFELRMRDEVRSEMDAQARNEIADRSGEEWIRRACCGISTRSARVIGEIIQERDAALRELARTSCDLAESNRALTAARNGCRARQRDIDRLKHVIATRGKMITFLQRTLAFRNTRRRQGLSVSIGELVRK